MSMALSTSETMLATFNFISPNVTLQPYVRPFDETGIIVSAAILFTFLVIGLFGNILTIVVILKNAKLRNIFMHFILSLCVSDLISALISWLFLYRRTWGFDIWNPVPDFLCTFYWAADIMTNYVTALHILSFAIIRYISIQYPTTFNKMRFVHAKVWMGTIWMVCFLCGFIPIAIFYGSRVPDRLSNQPNAKWPACTLKIEWYDQFILYQKVCYSIFLYVPTIGVILLSALIAGSVRSHIRHSQSTEAMQKRLTMEKQAVLQLVLIAISFLIGYVPFTVYEFWTVQPRANTQENKVIDYWFGMIEYFFLRFSECLNPIFYNFGSAKMRKYTADFLRKHCRLPAVVLRDWARSRASSTQSGNANDMGV